MTIAARRNSVFFADLVKKAGHTAAKRKKRGENAPF
jgi:hypothetical protein